MHYINLGSLLAPLSLAHVHKQFLVLKVAWAHLFLVLLQLFTEFLGFFVKGLMDQVNL